MRRLARAAEAWLWFQVGIGVVGIITLLATLAGTWVVLHTAARIMGL